MKKYIKEIIISILQVTLFYLYPLAVTDPMAMVLLINVGTFMLSLVFGCISNNKNKYFYSVFTAIIFIPSVFIYYNESALIHALGYLIVACIGIRIGSLIKVIWKGNANNEKQ